MKKILIRVILLIVLVGGAYAGYTAFQARMQQRVQSLATTKVRQGDVIVRSFARGELRAVRAVTLTAPNLFGTVQVTRLAPLGSFAREKDLITEFDDAEVISRMEEKQLELDQIDEQMKKAQADVAIRDNQDQVELLRARYAVRRAELEVKKNELISAIDAKKNQLSLDETKRRLRQLESDIKSRQEQSQAEIAVLREKKNKANLEMTREGARLNQVKLLAPISGLVAIKQNRSSVMMFGMTLPDIREGDQVQPGTPVADILDLSEMEVLAKVGELDRANLREGQEVSIQLDAIADKTFKGRIKAMSGTASANTFSGEVQKKFDVVFSIDMKQLMSALGAKPDQIAKVLATAEANRKKPPVAGLITASAPTAPVVGGPGAPMGGAQPPQTGPSAGGAPQGIAMQGAPGGAPVAGGIPGGAAADGESGRRAGGPGGGMLVGLTEEQQKKYREAMQKALGQKTLRDLSPEERQQVMAKVRTEMEKAGVVLPQRGAQRPNAGPGAPAMMPFASAGSGPFSRKDIENAKLPPPPEEDSQFDVLLRPGLLADVEIIVEKIPNAIHIPMQAVFEREGKQVVYVKNGNKFELREIKPSKRSESTLVVSSGVKPGEVLALADPNERPGSKKNSGKSAAPSAGVPLPKS